MEANHDPIPPAPGSKARRSRRPVGALSAAAALAGLAAILPATAASAASVPRQPYLVSRTAAGAAADGYSNEAALSGDGRYVAFTSSSKSLIADEGGKVRDVFVKDRWSGKVERVSSRPDGAEANGDSYAPSISDDGRFVAFSSLATNLAGSPTNGRANVWVRDRVTGQLVRASIGHDGSQLTEHVTEARLSGNGRFVAYATVAANVVPNDTNGHGDVFVRDLHAKTNERVSVSLNGGQATATSHMPSISDDGSRVAFRSEALLAGGQHDGADIFVRDRTAKTTYLAHLSAAKGPANGNAALPLISGNGRYVAFNSGATNLVANDTNQVTDVFRHDLQTGSTVRVSVHANGSQLGVYSLPRAIADDGSRVLFETKAVATSEADAGDDIDALVRTYALSATTHRVSTGGHSADPAGDALPTAMSDDGATVAFSRMNPSLHSEHPASTGQVYVSEALALGPHPDLGTLIHRQFQDFLGRKAGDAEMHQWYGAITAGRATPATLITHLASDPAFASKRAPVVRLYWAFFLRKPDPSGLQHWMNSYQKGASLASIAEKFAQSSEFKNRYGNVSNQQFVKLVFDNVFQRQPDPSGLSYWTKQLDQKKRTRGTVLVGFSESSEGARRLAPQVHITLISTGMLRTAPSPIFWDQAFAVYQSGEKELAWLAHRTLVSPAYGARFP